MQINHTKNHKCGYLI